MPKHTFSNMTETKHREKTIPGVCIGIVGYGFIGKAGFGKNKMVRIGNVSSFFY